MKEKMMMHGKYTNLVKPLFEEGWFNKLKPFIDSPEFDKIIDFLKEEKKLGKLITPLDINCFRAFKECKYDNLKVVILGQDPHPKLINNNLEADGLAFSYTRTAPDDNYIPKSLKVIFTEVERDYYNNDTEFADVVNGANLTRWSIQGVLLLNTALTTLVGVPGVHIDVWAPFTKYVLKTISEDNPGTIFMLWGGYAQAYTQFINGNTNHILIAPHPTAQFYSGGKTTFSGCEHFTKANKIIEESNGRDYCIRW